MSTRHITRTALSFAAGAALLGLAACSSGGVEGAGAGESDGGAVSAEQSTTEGATAPTRTATTTEETTGTGTSDGTATAGGGVGDASTRVSILLVLDVPEDPSGHTDGAPEVPATDLATTLSDALGADATCEGDLLMEEGNAATCSGPPSGDAPTADTITWTAYAAAVPAEDGFPDESTQSILFVSTDELTDGSQRLLENGTVLTGVGVGSMFGAQDRTAEELADATKDTLTSKNAYVPLTDAGFREVTCEDGMSAKEFAAFDTVDCTGTTEDGTAYPLVVAPGSYADNDQGLLVGIRTVTG